MHKFESALVVLLTTINAGNGTECGYNSKSYLTNNVKICKCRVSKAPDKFSVRLDINREFQKAKFTLVLPSR